MIHSVLFAADLDNTLFRSRNYPHEGYPCIEYIHGKEQAFMSPEVIAVLPAIRRTMLFVPVTSRSIEQYNRILWPSECTPKYAVVSDGANLLINGEPDTEWADAAQSLIASHRAEMNRLYHLFSASSSFIRCRIVDDAYLFVYCAKDISPSEKAVQIQSETYLDVEPSGKKIYILPPSMNKGYAIDNLKQRFSPAKLISAGDSEMDLPMLNRSDCAIFPDTISSLVSASECHICPPQIYFPEFVCRSVLM